jgi:hypothetical protein
MSAAMRETLARFRQYPPLFQWLLIGAVAAIVFIFWSIIVWDTSKAWNAQADEYAAALERASAGEQRIGGVTAAAILALGETEPIGNSVEGEQALSALIIDVLQRNRASGRDVTRKENVSFRSGDLPPIFPGGRGERAITEVRFEATPDAAFDIISELESSPLVETVSKVQIGKGNDTRRKTVVVNLTVEAWVSPGAAPSRPLQPRGNTPAQSESVEQSGESDGDGVAAASNNEGSAIP